MGSKKFTRTIEDFRCEHCGHEVIGDGYTNHCSECLWSKHVDINPGDRESTCGGMMKPIGLQIKGGEYILSHQCEKCGFRKKNKTRSEDNQDEIIKLSSRPVL